MLNNSLTNQTIRPSSTGTCSTHQQIKGRIYDHLLISWRAAAKLSNSVQNNRFLSEKKGRYCPFSKSWVTTQTVR